MVSDLLVGWGKRGEAKRLHTFVEDVLEIGHLLDVGPG